MIKDNLIRALLLAFLAISIALNVWLTNSYYIGKKTGFKAGWEQRQYELEQGIIPLEEVEK